MKRYIVIIVTAFLFVLPTSVWAKNVNFYDLMYSDDNILLSPGDVIEFSTPYSSWTDIYHIYIDGVRVDDNYYVDENNNPFDDALNSYTISKKVILSGLYDTGDYIMDPYGSNRYYINNMNFVSSDESNNFYRYTEITDGQVFSSGDIINFNIPRGNDLSIYFYDADRELEFAELVYYNVPIKNYLFPEIDGKKAYWKVDFFEDGLYRPGVFPHFYQVNYTEPEFSLKCDDKEIDYGKKTTCHLYVTSKYEMNEFSFDMNLPNFKISNIILPKEVKSTSGERMYNYLINQGYANNGKNVLLLSFDLEGTKNENYIDGIDLMDIDYKDEILTGSYQKVSSKLGIKPSKKDTINLTNPKTYANIIYMLLPLILLFVAFVMVKLFEKENKKKI